MISFLFALVVDITLIRLCYEVKFGVLTITLIKADAFSACHCIRCTRTDVVLESDETSPCSGFGSGLSAATTDANMSSPRSHLNQLNKSEAARKYRHTQVGRKT